MYKKILVALENSAADRALLPHVTELARRLQSQLLLVHVADGWAARHFEELNLRESEEIKADRAYLAQRCEELRRSGLSVESRLAMGDPSTELIRIANEEKVDLIAMSTHGHRFLSDVIHGTTVDRLRHKVFVPVLLLRGQT